MNKEFGYCRVGAAVPVVKPGAVADNVGSMVDSAEGAAAAGVDLLVFPELSITGYTCADLFFQDTLLDAAVRGLQFFLDKTVALETLFVVGMPLRINGLLLNCAVICRKGSVCGVVPKLHLPNTREFYEQRWFSSGADLYSDSFQLLGQEIPVGLDLTFHFEGFSECIIGVELCEDLWSVVPPSSRLALQGATLICNLSASNELVGKYAYRHDLVKQQSARCIAAYVYSGAGVGESSTDLVFGGDAMIAENGRMLGQGDRFSRQAMLLTRDIDCKLLAFERHQNKVFQQSMISTAPGRRVGCGKPHDAKLSDDGARALLREVDPHPFVPADSGLRSQRCQEIFAIQSSGLATRLAHIGCRNVVIGLSGGLDSSLALLVAVEAFDRLNLDKKGIYVITMPGFGTTERTLGNTHDLVAGLGLELETIDITKACEQHLSDIGHSVVEHDIAYENTQARERTQILMDRANMLSAMVIGTGDLSELALGWCTYNGDHMSMYGVNSGVPKTLVRYLVKWVAEYQVGAVAAKALFDVLETPVSPELLPADEDGKISQKTEDVIGPYELHDFFLYNFIRCGFSVSKIQALAEIAFDGVYLPDVIDCWLKLFFKRFFSQQFKRSCMPDGPKVGSINLSPRGDWRMPSDASSELWSL